MKSLFSYCIDALKSRYEQLENVKMIQTLFLHWRNVFGGNETFHWQYLVNLHLQLFRSVKQFDPRKVIELILG